MTMLTHSQVDDALEYCRDRNHANIEVPADLIARMEKAQTSLRDVPCSDIIDWWGQDALEVSDEELEVIMDCIYTNSAMEDSPLPKWCYKRRKHDRSN